jgi:hypothetical protein
MERRVSHYLRKWLGAPPGLSRAALYRMSAKFTLPLSSVVEEYKVGKVRALMTLKESQDQKISAAEPEVRTGKKWSAKEAWTDADSRSRHKKIVGIPARGRQGLGFGVAY